MPDRYRKGEIAIGQKVRADKGGKVRPIIRHGRKTRPVGFCISHPDKDNIISVEIAGGFIIESGTVQRFADNLIVRMPVIL